MFKKIATGLFFVSLLSGCVGGDSEYDFSEYEEQSANMKPSFSKEEINSAIALHKETFVDYKKEWKEKIKREWREEVEKGKRSKFVRPDFREYERDKLEYQKKRREKSRHLKHQKTVRHHAMRRWKKANNVETDSKEQLEHEKRVLWETGKDIVSREEKERRYVNNTKIKAFDYKITKALLFGPLDSIGYPKSGRSIYEWKDHDIIDYEALFVDQLDKFQMLEMGCRDNEAVYFWSSRIWSCSEEIQQKYAPEGIIEVFMTIFHNGPLTSDGEVKPGRCILELKGIDIIDYDKLFFDDEDRERMEAIGREEFEASQAPSHEEAAS